MELYYCTNSFELIFLLKNGLCHKSYKEIYDEINQLLEFFSQYIDKNININEVSKVYNNNIHIYASVSKALDHYNKKRALYYKYIIDMYKNFLENIDNDIYIMFKNKYLNWLPFLDDNMIYPIILKIDDSKYDISKEYTKKFSQNTVLNSDILSRMDYCLPKDINIDKFKISMMISNFLNDNKQLYPEISLIDMNSNLYRNYELLDI